MFSFYIFINIILAAKVGCTYYRYISSILQYYCNILIYNWLSWMRDKRIFALYYYLWIDVI